jgi:hypothetical protein
MFAKQVDMVQESVRLAPSKSLRYWSQMMPDVVCTWTSSFLILFSNYCTFWALYSGCPASSSSLKASLIRVKNFSKEKEASLFQKSVSKFAVADAARHVSCASPM